MSKEIKETDKPRNSLLTLENKQMAARGDMGGGMAEIGDREEGMPLS